MKPIIKTALIFLFLILISTSANSYDASQTDKASINFTHTVTVQNVSVDDLTVLATIGEVAVGNTTSSDGMTYFGFLFTTIRTVNGTTNVSAPIICIDTWSCTGWVENGSFQYRQCSRIDTTCTSEDFKPEEIKVADETIIIMLIPFFTAAILLTVAFLLRESEDIIARTLLSILAIGMIIPGIGFGFAAMNDTPAVSAVQENLEAFLWVTFVITFAVMIYFVGKLIWKLSLKRIEKINQKLRPY